MSLHAVSRSSRFPILCVALFILLLSSVSVSVSLSLSNSLLKAGALAGLLTKMIKVCVSRIVFFPSYATHTEYVSALVQRASD